MTPPQLSDDAASGARPSHRARQSTYGAAHTRDHADGERLRPVLAGPFLLSLSLPTGRQA
jgi:hypothetical protein